MKKRFLFLSLAMGCMAQLKAQDNYSWDHLPTAKEPVFKKDTVRITDYGAVSDGITLNTKSINDAIAACSKKGGGVVLVPPGLWLTGPIEMQSNVNLHVAAAAIIQFTSDFNQYKLVKGSYEGLPSYRNQSPISGTSLENIAITGKGIIDGNGGFWRMVTKDRLTDSEWKNKVKSGGFVGADGRTWYPSKKTLKGQQTKNNGQIQPGKTAKDYEDIKDFLRPNLLVLTGCKKVLLEGVTFQNSPAWCLHPLMCEDLTVRNVYAKNPDYAQNGDGIDVESCKNVLIEGSTFDVGDDGICIKSGRDEAGRERGMPTENVVIRNCVVYHAHGGFVIGSEMSGGARNIFVYDCAFMGTDKGIRFKTTRGRGGIVEKIYVRDINMKDIVQEAIFFDMYYFVKARTELQAAKDGVAFEMPAVTEATPQFRDFHISNIVCEGANKGIFIRGLPEMNVQNIYLDHLILTSRIGAEFMEASGIHLDDVQLYPMKKDPVIYIENSHQLSFNNLRFPAGTTLLFSLNGDRCKQIKVTNTQTGGAQKLVQAQYGATDKGISIQ